MISRGFLCLILVINLSSQVVASVDASKPQLGWNSYNAFHDNVSADLVKTTADKFIELGLKDAGYEYVIMDDGWSHAERRNGELYWNETKFPQGIIPVSNYVHSLGLKFGIYSGVGIYGCSFLPGGWGYEELDAKTFAKWGVDYLKVRDSSENVLLDDIWADQQQYDNCGLFEAAIVDPRERFAIMRDALLQSGRDIWYSMCNWGNQFPWFWADQVSHSYRMSGDIWKQFSTDGSSTCKTAYCLNTGYASCSVLTIIRKMREISPFQAPGSWADMDMLEIGNGIMAEREEQTHMSFWAALKSPLIIGADLNNISKSSLDILTNSDIIGINQDALGLAVRYIPELSTENKLQVWAGLLSNDRLVALILNERSDNATTSVSLSLNGLSSYVARDGISERRRAESSAWNPKGYTTVRSIWDKQRFAFQSVLNLTIASHETKVLVLE